MARRLKSLDFYKTNVDYTETTIIVTGLFFLWGFITSMNGILMPKLQQDFNLDNFATILLQSAFFGAYFIISLVYYLFSIIIKDPIELLGFRRFIILGLTISGIGCFLFYPAAEHKQYELFVAALFVLASGITILQLAANPYVSMLGSQKNAASRLNMAQAVNSFGTFVAPLTSVLITSVQLPYLALAGSIFFFAFLLSTTEFPRVLVYTEKKTTFGVFKNKQLVLGALAIFMYVGGEVSVGSNLTKFIRLKEIGNVPESDFDFYLMLFWGGAMFGRLIGAIMLSNMKQKNKTYIIYFVLVLTLAGGWFVKESILFSAILLGLTGLSLLVSAISNYIPSKTLGYFAATIMFMLLVASFTEGSIAMWSIVGIGLFNSIMFPTIFTLAIQNLKEYTTQGSSILVMGIVGGAFIPILQNLAASTSFIGIQKSFLIPLVCYGYVMYFGLRKDPEESTISS